MNLGELHRLESGRILASLIRVVGDFELAEDALQDAFEAALAQWTGQGWPADPSAWLYSTARYKAVDRLRRRTLDQRAQGGLADLHPPGGEEGPTPGDALALMFTCCHPALGVEAQVALTLRTVGGLSTEEVARAFLVPVPTMAQRLVRAKAKIRAAQIPYEIPAAAQLPERLRAVMDVLYLVFNEGYSATQGAELVREELCSEAVRLARMLRALLPTQREPMGLLALMLLQDARRRTRLDGSGELVLLEDQDRAQWDTGKIREGLALVEPALRGGMPGPFALQAAVAALHAQAPTADRTDWPQIAALYSVLAHVEPSPVVELNRAVAIAMADGPEHGLAMLELLHLPNYHLLPAARADLLRRLGRREEAATAYREALGLVTHATERRFLERRLAEVTLLAPPPADV